MFRPEKVQNQFRKLLLYPAELRGRKPLFISMGSAGGQSRLPAGAADINLSTLRHAGATIQVSLVTDVGEALRDLTVFSKERACSERRDP